MLCTSADVAVVLGRDPGNVDDLIDIVTGILEGGAAVGRPISDTTPLTITVTGAGRRVLELPDWPLTAVADVVDDGVTLVDGTDYLVDLTTGTLTRLIGRWSVVDAGVTLTATRAVPSDLRSLCARVVARIWRAQQADIDIVTDSPELVGLTQLTVGQWSATVGTGVDPAAAFDLTALDVAILEAWRDRRP